MHVFSVFHCCYTAVHLEYMQFAISEACCIGEKRMAAYVSQKFESLNNTGAFINFYTILTHLVFGDTSCMFPLLFKLWRGTHIFLN